MGDLEGLCCGGNFVPIYPGALGKIADAPHTRIYPGFCQPTGFKEKDLWKAA